MRHVRWFPECGGADVRLQEMGNSLFPVQRIMAAEYEVPADVRASPECQDMLSRMLMGPPQRRISIDGIKA